MEDLNNNVCLHCEKREPSYCEKCFQELINENTLLRLRISELEKEVAKKDGGIN